MSLYGRLSALYDELPEKAPLFFEYRPADIIADINDDGVILSAVRERTAVPVPVSALADPRLRRPAPLPLFDRLCFIANDLPADRALHTLYLKGLCAWGMSQHATPQLRAVMRCVAKSGLCARLAAFGVLSGEPSRDRELFTVFTLNGQHLWENVRFVRSYTAFCRERLPTPALCTDTGAAEPPAVYFPSRLTSARSAARLIAEPPRGVLHGGVQVCAGLESTLKAHEALRQLLRRAGVRVGESVFAAFTECGELPLYGLFDGEVRSQQRAQGAAVTVLCVSEYAAGRLYVTLWREVSCGDFNAAVTRYAESGALPIREEALRRAGSNGRYAQTLCRRLLNRLLDESMQNGAAVLPSPSGRVFN